MKKTPLSTAVRTCVLLTFAVLALAGIRTSAQANSDAVQTPPLKVPARITQAINEQQLFQAKGSVHGLARPEFDQGPVSDSAPMKRMRLVLQRSPEQQAALKQLMSEQMIGDSPNFHKWLTPQEFGARFGPADADINVITGWLGSKGFTDIHVSPGRLTVEFSGNVGQVRNVFHTDIHRFLIDGEVKQANVSDPQFPAALSPVVRGIATLHDFSPQSYRHTRGLYTKKPDGTIVPQFTFTGGNPPTQFFAVGPGDFAKIYNIPAALDGTGGKIAIVGFSDINPADVDSFRALFGLPAKNLNIVVNGPDPGFNGEEGEAALDVQASGAVAPKAQIDYILSETSQASTPTQDGLTLSAQYVIDNNSDDVMSLSFGACEVLVDPNLNALVVALWEQAASQGITVVVSSGDNGSAGCDNFNTQKSATRGNSVNAFASTPFNVAVGGTDFDDVGTQISGGFWSATNATGKVSAQGYIHEVPWNDSCAATATAANLTTCATPDNIVAGSGGASLGSAKGFYDRPPFQNGIVPNGIASGVAALSRYVPDISLFASDGAKSNSFYVECQADAGATCITGANGTPFQGVGGTSASAPSFAGILALIGQSEANAGRSRRLGNANFVLYNLAQTPANICNSSTTPLTGSATCVFYDITKGNNSVPCSGGAAANCSAATGGVLVTANPVANTPAYTATAGYDLTTGLGTLNVTNLASKWHSATLSATTTTTTINGATAAINITHGTLVTLAASVTSGAGTPTGDVSFLAPQGTIAGGIGNITLDNTGNVSGQSRFLPGGGPYLVKAHYGGDATFAPSDDPTGVQVTVAKENSKLQMELVTFDPNTGAVNNVNATNFAFGSPYILRFDILNSAGPFCQTVVLPAQGQGNLADCAIDAAGTVIITNNGAPLDQGTFNVNSQGAGEDQPIDLTAGPHTIIGIYSGDTSYLPPAAPTTLNLNVAQAMTTTTVAATPPTNVTTGTPVVLTATISSQSISVIGAGGTVTFADNGTAIGTPVMVTAAGATKATFAGGAATLSTTFATAGNHTITATYSGDANYATSTSTVLTVTVTAANPSFTVTGTPPTITAGSNGTSTITATPSGGFTGMVNVTCTSTTGATSVAAVGITCTPNPLPLNITTASAVTGTLTITVAANSTTLTASNLPSPQKLPNTLGDKGLLILGAGTGFAAFLLLFLPGRKRLRAALGLGLVCLISLALGCSGVKSGGGGPVPSVTTITVDSSKKAAGTQFNFTVSVTGGTATPTGMVQLFDGGTALGAPTALDATGKAAIPNALATGVGTHTISAHYVGDAAHNASASGNLMCTETGPTTLTITGVSGGTTKTGTLSLTVN